VADRRREAARSARALAWGASESAIDADLTAGRHREVVGELEALVAEQPLRERLHGLRMLALYDSGRQAGALEVYRDGRTALVEQVGVEPGPALRRVHEAILRQDPALEPPTVETFEFPPELDTRTSLAGRTDELDVLREHGTRLLAVSDRGHGVRSDMSQASWLRHACGVAGRELAARVEGRAARGRTPICGG